MSNSSVDRHDGFIDMEYRKRKFEKFTVGEKVKIVRNKRDMVTSTTSNDLKQAISVKELTKRFGVIIYKSSRIIVVKYANDGEYKGVYTEAFDVLDTYRYLERGVK